MVLRRRWSVRTRLTLFAGVSAALLSAMLSAFLLIAVNRLATEYLADEVASAGAKVAVRVGANAVPIPNLLPPHKQIQHIQVIDPQRKVVGSTALLRGKPPMANFTPDQGEGTATSVVCGHQFPEGECYVVVAYRVLRSGEPWLVYSAAPVVPPVVHPKVATLVVAGILFLTAVITFGTYRVVSGSLSPVDAIRVKLDEINATCPDHRVPVPKSKDEIHELAESVNRTLDRLQTAMEQQRQFTSDVSHDLRSPITAMRVQLEDALLAPDEVSVDGMSDALLNNLDRLQAIVHDLLVIARLDSGAPGARQPVDLAELAGSELNNRRTAKQIKHELQPGAVVMGDRLRLTRLFTNLMDNAERHAETTITVTVRQEPGDLSGDRRFAFGAAVLEVADDGAGIEPDKREAVFQRFTRLDAGLNKDAGGTGLGLPIARQIAEISSGTLTIEPSEQGARFVLRLPLATEVTKIT